MSVWIALLRGINVGGRVLRMKDLVALLENEGFEDVKTYVQSGNAVFRSRSRSAATLSRRIASAVAARYGFEPQVMTLTAADLRAAAKGNPFRDAEATPTRLHLYFLAAAPKKPDLEKLQTVARPSENFALRGAVFYLHTPEGYGTSKLAERAERVLGVPATARNWRTVEALLDMTK